MITLHNILIISKIQHSSTQCTLMKWIHHYLLWIRPHHVTIISVLICHIQITFRKIKLIPYNQWGIHSKSKHKYRHVFGNSNIQYHDFNNGDALTFTDKYTALLQQELQNPYWCLHDPIANKSYQISSEMDIETMTHAMYFSGSKETLLKSTKFLIR